MTQANLQLFLQKLDTLCAQFGIFIPEKKEWKERPNASYYFYDVQVRAKVEDERIKSD